MNFSMIHQCIAMLYDENYHKDSEIKSMKTFNVLPDIGILFSVPEAAGVYLLLRLDSNYERTSIARE